MVPVMLVPEQTPVLAVVSVLFDSTSAVRHAAKLVWKQSEANKAIMPRKSWMRRVFNLKSPSVYWHAESELILATFLVSSEAGRALP